MPSRRASFSRGSLWNMAKGRRKGCFRFLGSLIVLLAFVGGYSWYQLRPLPIGPNQYVRFNSALKLEAALAELERRQIIRSSRFTQYFAGLSRNSGPIVKGTYLVSPGMNATQVLKAIRQPIRRLVRIREGWWINRVAKKLEEQGVCKAEDYVKWASRPQEFQSEVSFPLPEQGTLEGYLYPDTYDLPPLIDAKDIVSMQLRAFQNKVADKLPPNQTLRALTVASLVEAETAMDRERPIVAGVIENRLKKGMRLEIDATVLYGIQDWRVLGPGEVRMLASPYNTYLHKGLPPGPIGSPSLKSIEAALKPAHQGYFYYVALPDKTQLFAATYEEHLANIKKRMAAIKAQGASK